MSAARIARKGAWPEAGGTNDQTAVFLTACEICWAEEDAIRAELKLNSQD